MKPYIPLLVLVIAISVAFGYIRPQYDVIQSLQADRAEVVAALARADDVGNKRDQLLQAYRSFPSTDMDRLKKALPDKADQIQLMVDLNALAVKYGSTVPKDAKPQGSGKSSGGTTATTTNDGRPYTSSTLTIGLSMEYPNFLKFLADVERNLRITDVSGMSVKYDDKTGSYDYTVDLKTYSLR